MLGEVERGNRVPTTTFLRDVAEQLGITMEELKPPINR